MLKGIPVSPGVAISKALFLQNSTVNTEKKSITKEQIALEQKKLETALEKTEEQLTELHQQLLESVGEEQASIMSAHLVLLKDPAFIDEINNHIENDLIDVSSAVQMAADQFVQLFESLDDEYMRERATDIKDIANRLISNILGKNDKQTIDTKEAFILVSDDLTPSETVTLPREQVEAIIVAKGGKTSHAAILARSLGIPAIMGVGDQLANEVKTGDNLIIDGSTGKIYINPESSLIHKYQEKQQEEKAEKEELAKLKDKKATTRDGNEIELVANIKGPQDAEEVLQQGGEGIGLFRSEFLFMDRTSLPSEEEQYEAYSQVVKKLGNRPVIIRTLDIGGDKHLPYLDLPEEMNPFLGWRAIRISLSRPELFQVQLRALLRASAHGKVRIMFPMISHLEQIQEVKRILEETKKQLTAENIAFDPEIEIGVMIEIPSACLIADELAKEVDFFSIGTNDLVQYTLAVDRMNEKITDLYDHFHPAVLRLIKMVIDASHRHNIWTGMCGEMAGDLQATEILLGLGLDEFSVSPTLLPRVKHQLLQLSTEKAKQVAEKTLSLGTSKEVLEYITASH
ncbi:phosphoenolpyruvate--protein phosphotransferase [Shimazuella sp. AN120528]|uniref:phosphoenolpyruvate--protein phosphotransferase n=1 Tax=Shimazuella soli TaxID=1892854 RepID=UPI001F108358|nr:phosphoenolpyruvate--protein phosphotransferase [Shimazuella soli]MCH5586451.1 phosphoenolpyruvate--protein phosphotransferase [Shimazuella soli]